MIDKLKNWLGVEGVKVTFDDEINIDKKTKIVSGSLILSSKSDQYITTINIAVTEKYTRGRRKSKLVEEFEIGSKSLTINKAIHSEEIIRVDFAVPFVLIQSDIEEWGNKNFIYQGLSKTAKFLKNANSKYYLLAEVDVKGNRLKPYFKKEIQF